MNKLVVLALLESERNSLIKNISDKNSNKIVGLFESSGLLKKGEASNSQAVPSRSKRPDIMEMDAKSNGGIYDASVKEEPNKTPVSTSKEPSKEPKKEPSKPKDKVNPKESSNDKEESKPNTEQKKDSSKSIVEKNSGYPQIQLTEDLKDIDESQLDGVLTKEELNSVLTANNDAKIEVFRNLLFVKKSDFGHLEEYECFTSGKGGTKMVKGIVPYAYISDYYVSKSEIQRPDTKEAYLVLSSKIKGSEEHLSSMSLQDNASKYIVFTSDLNNNSEYITVLDESEFDMLFHQARND